MKRNCQTLFLAHQRFRSLRKLKGGPWFFEKIDADLLVLTEFKYVSACLKMRRYRCVYLKFCDDLEEGRRKEGQPAVNNWSSIDDIQ